LEVMRLRPPRIATLAALAVAAAVVAGCGGDEATSTGSIPETASLAPRDAIGFVSIVTDEDSGQWQRADRLLQLFPGARADLLAEIEGELTGEGLTWEGDVEPALGPEVVLVVTKDRKGVLLTQPDDAAAFEALMRRADEPYVKETVSGWTAVAMTAADLSGYRQSLTQGTLDEVESFRDALTSLPEEALAVGWVDLKSAGEGFSAFGETVDPDDVGAIDLAAAVSAEDDGLLVSLGVQLPEGAGTTSYEAKLLDRVPADAVAVVSFGGTQGALDRVERSVDVEGILGAIDDTLGVPIEGVFESLSGEGVLYVRESDGDLPEVTLVLDPPNADKTWTQIEEIAANVADEAGGRIETGSEGGRPVNRLVLEELTVVYARPEDETLLVTTGTNAIGEFTSDASKLTDDERFRAAADRVDLGDRTNGFAYVDLNGLIAFIEDLGGPDALPSEGREVLEALDSVILQTSSDGERARFQGFVQTTR
jgi:hypothetical protein